MIYEGIGIVGVILILVAYFLLQSGKVIADDLRFIFANIFGSTGILISLSNKFNFSAALIEICWLIIALYGLARYFLKRRNSGENSG